MKAAIGVLDSGVGGLTVLKEIRRLLPGEDVVYIGDTARVPYGPRPPEEIARFMQQMLRFFAEKRVKLAVFACNTITVCGYRAAAGKYPFALVGMNVGARRAAEVTQSGRIGLIATAATVESGVHARLLKEIDPSLSLCAQPCPQFVALIEAGKIGGPEVEEAARRCLAPIKEAGVDTLILGCTHFPIIEAAIQAEAGPGVRLVDPALATAEDAVRALRSRSLLRAGGERGALDVYFTGAAAQARAVLAAYLPAERPALHTVDLAAYA